MFPEDLDRAALAPTCKEAGSEGVFQDDVALTSKLSLSQAVDPTLSQLEAQERSSLESQGQRSELTNGRIFSPFLMAK